MGAAREVRSRWRWPRARSGEVRDVPGRMETIRCRTKTSWWWWTARTRRIASRSCSGRTLQPPAAGRAIVVFGCGGDRDRAKRAPMGQAATSSADLSVITTDNPRSGRPARHHREIVPGRSRAVGLRRGSRPTSRDPSRPAGGEAGRHRVAIAGKGHEAVPRGGRDRGAVRRPVDAPGTSSARSWRGVKPRPLSSVAAAVGGERTGDDVDALLGDDRLAAGGSGSPVRRARGRTDRRAPLRPRCPRPRRRRGPRPGRRRTLRPRRSRWLRPRTRCCDSPRTSDGGSTERSSHRGSEREDIDEGHDRGRRLHEVPRAREPGVVQQRGRPAAHVLGSSAGHAR